MRHSPSFRVFGPQKVPRPYSLKRVIQFSLIILFSSAFLNAQAQSVFVAGFDSDADIYSGVPATVNADDWFQGTTGDGVMDPVPFLAFGAYPILTNISFESNLMTLANGSVDAEGNTWLAGVFGRDWNAIAGETDQTSFITGGSEKNGDNPQTWICTPGQVQNKNDIIDYGAHLRMDAVTDDLWFFGMVSIASDNGNHHMDFEFYREDIADANSCFGVNTGPHGGHTAWMFDLVGNITSSGDVIVTFDFTSGGDLLNENVYVWINETELPASDGDPFGPFVWDGEFYSGDGATVGDDVWGYAKIKSDTDEHICTIANQGTEPLAPPYGTISKEGGTYDNSYYPENKMAEIAVNLTGFGFDFDDLDPCSQLFGSVYVKTRASQEFTAELKDGAGPASFGTELEVLVVASVDGELDCTTPTVQLFATADPVDVTYLWTGPDGATFIPDNTAQNPLVDMPGVYSVVATLENGCSNEPAEDVTVLEHIDDEPPLIFCPPDFEECPEYVIPDPAADFADFVSMGGSASDADSGLNEASFAWLGDVIFGKGCNITVTRTYYIEDLCGNEATCSQTYNLFDGLAPQVVCPDPFTAGACLTQDQIDQMFADWLALFSSTDNCGDPIESFSGATPPDACGGEAIVTFSAADNCGFESSCISTFNVMHAPDLSVTCPPNENLGSCLTQDAVDDAFADWIAGFSYSGGCGAVATDLSGYSAPPFCGGSVTINYVASDDCDQEDSCSSTFSVAFAPDLSVTCPPNENLGSCLTQDAVDDAFADWIAGFSYSGGCGAVATDLSGYSAPPFCGGSVTINYVASDDCDQEDSCSSTFSVAFAPDLSVTCPPNENLGSCLTQDAVDDAFADWIAGFSYSGGCGAVATDLSGYSAPPFCGGSVTINYAASDDCDQEDSCSSTFSVAFAPDLSVICPSDVFLKSCLSHGAVEDAFADWIEGFGYTGGCGTVTTDLTGYNAPSFCGGSVSINFVASDDCGQEDSCFRTFFVLDAPQISVTCPPADVVECSDNEPLPMLSDVTISTNCGIASSSIELLSTEADGCNTIFVYRITVTDICDYTDFCDWERTMICPCDDPYCTLTQGYYGNEGGLYCDSTSTIDLLDDLLAGGPLMIGLAGNSFTIQPDEASCIILALPGGGTPAVIAAGDHGFNENCMPTGGIAHTSGNWDNTLAAQVLTLSLNIRIPDGVGGSGELADLVIPEACFTTVESTDCDNPEAVAVPGTELTFCIPDDAYNYFASPPTVQELLNLANMGLAGVDAGVSLGDLTAAVKAINDGFDECRILSATPDLPILPFDTSGRTSIEDGSLQFTLSPNPASQYVRVSLDEMTESATTLEVINQFGQVLYTSRVVNRVFDLQLERFKSGLYFLRIKNAEGSMGIERIVIAR